MAIRTDTSSPIPDIMSLKSNQDNSQDANSALLELEKGLRSGKVGEQCEATVRFPSLFAKYPFPILVNSAFLKLADVFRGGTNFMKLCVLKVIQGSEKHLDKILNVDEFLRRLYTVIHSNDPVARAITLRIFGCSSSIIYERKNVHHSIRNSLDSHDQVEVEAAIFATKCFCKQSGQFAEGICHKIAEMIEGLSTPIDMKLKLIPAFQNMYHDLKSSTKAQELCHDLLTSYPAREFVLVTLHTLTCLAAATLMNISTQVNILLSFLKEDPRQEVKRGSLKNLQILAEKEPHLWNSIQIEKLTDFAVETASDPLKQKALIVLSTVSRSLNKTNLFNRKVLEILEQLTDSTDIQCATLALLVGTNVLATDVSQGVSLNPDLSKKFDSNVQLLMALSVAENSLPALKRCFHCARKLSNISTSSKLSLTEFVVEILQSVTGQNRIEMCHCLVSMATSSPTSLREYKTLLLEGLKNAIKSCKENLGEETMIAMMTLVLHSGFECPKDEVIALQKTILQMMAPIDDKNYWTVYRIGRLASRMGYPLLSSTLFSMLTAKVASENSYLWLKALSRFQEAEATLVRDSSTISKLLANLMDAHNHYQQGLIDLKAAVTPAHVFYFQYKYAKLRGDTLRGFAQLLTCCSSLKTSPPPAIAMGASIRTGQEVHQLSRLASQFQECASSFSNTAKSYGRLYKTSFNSDPVTLKNVQVLQESCQLMSYAIDVLVLNRKEGGTFSAGAESNKRGSSANHLHVFMATNEHILQVVENVAIQTKDSPLSHMQIQCLCQSAASQLKLPIPYPLYFFKSMQLTGIKLNVSPSSKSSHDAVLVNVDSQLALNVEGLIEDKGRPGLFRKVQSVCLTVRAKAKEVTKPLLTDFKPKPPTDLLLQETVEPHHEYFSSQFLITFNNTGDHEVIVTASIRDENGALWDTGPQVIVFVDVHEHGYIRRTKT